MQATDRDVTAKGRARVRARSGSVGAERYGNQDAVRPIISRRDEDRKRCPVETKARGEDQMSVPS